MKCGLIGEKLSHSYSKIIHNKIAGYEYEYELYPLPKEELPAFLASDFRGMNVTIPYKKAVIPFCDTLSDTARAIGSVNTLVKDEKGLHGYNTDAYGFSFLARRAGISFEGKKVVILGSGGTSLTARYTAAQEGAREIAVISRTGENNYQNLHLHADAQIVVNTTPVGMFPENGACPVDLSSFPACEGVLDVIYNPYRTNLILEAQKRHIPAAGGLVMLAAQGVKASALFSGESLNEGLIETVLSALRQEILNIVLIGMPGSGKNSLGSRLAKRLRRDFINTDALIERKYAMTPAEIIGRFGQKRFRQIETETARETGKLSGKVIATGTGIVLSEDSMDALRQNGHVVYLMRDCDRLSYQGQPLLMGLEAAKELFEQRDPLYRAYSDSQISNNRLMGDVLKELTQIL